ncbi:penicillin-binding protein 1A [soil metagenome]
MPLLQTTAVFTKRLVRLAVMVGAIIAVTAASLALIGPQIENLTSAHRSDPERISLRPLAERSFIYDSQGNEQGVMTNRLDPQNRSQVSLEDIPDPVKESVLAVEDVNFYDHFGVNVRSILRAVDANLGSGGVSQGGSTITQQVIKNSLVGDDQDLSRKLREAILALELEKQMSKDDILEYYLNSVYFGGGAYGVQAAAEYYYSKDVSELNWAEGALLAALISSPNAYNPFNAPDVAESRRTIVFGRLIETGLLTDDEVAAYETTPLPTTPNRPVPPYDYFVEEVKQQLLADPSFGLGATEEARNRAVFEGGIRVYTTFNPAMQSQALRARDETLPANNGDATFDVVDPETGQTTFGTQSIVSVEPSSGAVRAMVGGPGFDKYQFNLALSRRQPGSAMKPLVMASLMENGYVPDDTVSGRRCSFDLPNDDEPYVPDTISMGTGTITSMLTRSSNCGFVRLGQVVDIDNVVELTRRLGVRGDVDPVISLPLGTASISPLEMASAYATFTNDGVRNPPYLVERIEDREGRIIYQHQASPERILEVQEARLVNEALLSVVEDGTGTRAQIEGDQPAAGKTGTTNDSADIWFVGSTPQLATAVWMGVPVGRVSLGSNSELEGATGGRFAAETWGRYYSLLYEDQPTVDFPEAEDTRRGRSVGPVPGETGRSSRSVRIFPPGDGGATRSPSTSSPPQTTTPAPAPPPLTPEPPPSADEPEGE